MKTLQSRRVFFASISLLAMLTFSHVTHAALVEKDDFGNTVQLAHPAQRIISFAPHLTEILYAAGAGQQMVGATEYSDYPEAAKRLPRVGSSFQVDIERVIALKPDLLVVWPQGMAHKQLELVRRLGIPIYQAATNRLLDIPLTIEHLGKLTGHDGYAQSQSNAFRVRYQKLLQHYQQRAIVSVFYQIGERPMYTLNGKHMVSEAIRLCGGHNVFSDLAAIAPVVSTEAVIAANPEVIVASVTLTGENHERLKSAPDTFEQHRGILQNWQRIPSLLATQRNNLFLLNADLMDRATPRILDATTTLCEQLDVARQRRKPHH